jgi:hypothetical protein
MKFRFTIPSILSSIPTVEVIGYSEDESQVKDALCVCITDGRLPIDNNQVERLMSLVASAQRQEIDNRDVLGECDHAPVAWYGASR